MKTKLSWVTDDYAMGWTYFFVIKDLGANWKVFAVQKFYLYDFFRA